MPYDTQLCRCLIDTGCDFGISGMPQKRLPQLGAYFSFLRQVCLVGGELQGQKNGTATCPSCGGAVTSMLSHSIGWGGSCTAAPQSLSTDGKDCNLTIPQTALRSWAVPKHPIVRDRAMIG